MLIGKKNLCATYTMENIPLTTTNCERDIGVMVEDNLKPGTQCKEAARRANGVLTQISRAFHYRNKGTFKNLYKQYVQPHLEFAVPAWSPWSQADKNILDKKELLEWYLVWYLSLMSNV